MSKDFRWEATGGIRVVRLRGFWGSILIGCQEEGTDTLLEWETELKEAQQNDSELKLLLQLKGCPKWQEVQNYHCLQKYLSVWDQLKIQDG